MIRNDGKEKILSQEVLCTQGEFGFNFPICVFVILLDLFAGAELIRPPAFELQVDGESISCRIVIKSKKYMNNHCWRHWAISKSSQNDKKYQIQFFDAQGP
jgi:hypothetical protein